VTVDPALASLLGAFEDGDALDVAQARAGLDAFALSVGAGAPAVPAEDDVVGGVPVRRYRPQGPVRGPELVWFHGGGWVTGTLDAVDPLCRSVAARTGAPLTSVGYRLAPEHPFPAALDDCTAVLRTLPGAVAVGGDSAGGGLAAAACLLTRDLGLRAQVLLNPLVDATLSSASISLLGDGYGLTRTALEHFVALYLDGADPRDPRCSPLLAEDLTGLPPAVVLTAELDPLRDEGEAYAARLREARVPVAARRFAGMVHGFAGMTAVTPVAGQALDWLVEELVRLTG
jgi:acetyl esterase